VEVLEKKKKSYLNFIRLNVVEINNLVELMIQSTKESMSLLGLNSIEKDIM